MTVAQRWVRQPPYRAELDPASQIARGIIGAGYAGYESFGTGLKLVNGATYQPGDAGLCLNALNSGSQYATASRNLDPTAVPFTILVVWRTTTLAFNTGLFQTNGANNFAGAAIICDTAGSISCYYGDNGGTNTTTNRRLFSTASGTAVVNQTSAVAFSITGATAGTCFVNGAPRTLTTAGSGGAYAGSSATPATVGARLSGTDIYGTKQIFGYSVWDRGLTDYELRDITLNPWQLWRAPQRRRLYSVPSGGASYDIAAATSAEASAAVETALLRVLGGASAEADASASVALVRTVEAAASVEADAAAAIALARTVALGVVAEADSAAAVFIEIMAPGVNVAAAVEADAAAAVSIVRLITLAASVEADAAAATSVVRTVAAGVTVVTAGQATVGVQVGASEVPYRLVPNLSITRRAARNPTLRR
jgi:hypothetical protein